MVDNNDPQFSQPINDDAFPSQEEITENPFFEDNSTPLTKMIVITNKHIKKINLSQKMLRILHHKVIIIILIIIIMMILKMILK